MNSGGFFIQAKVAEGIRQDFIQHVQQVVESTGCSSLQAQCYLCNYPCSYCSQFNGGCKHLESCASIKQKMEEIDGSK